MWNGFHISYFSLLYVVYRLGNLFKDWKKNYQFPFLCKYCIPRSSYIARTTTIGMGFYGPFVFLLLVIRISLHHSSLADYIPKGSIDSLHVRKCSYWFNLIQGCVISTTDSIKVEKITQPYTRLRQHPYFLLILSLGSLS